MGEQRSLSELEHEPEVVVSFDGTALAGRFAGDPAAPALLVVNAVGANLAPWRATLSHLVHDFSIAAWDLRGTHSSDPPATTRLDPSAHARDARAVVDHFGIGEVGVLSWSNGVRIALEIAHRYPQRVACSVMVAGAWGYQLGRLLRLELASVLPLIAGVGKRFAPFLQGPLGAFVARPELAGFVRQSGMVGARADTGALVEMLKGMAACDLRTLLATFEAVAGDPAPELLDGLTSPVLAVMGDRDQFTSRAVVEEMVARVPAGRLEMYHGATHYLPLEFPDRLARDARAFFEETHAA
jgi:pimeloyl-ACP methyl ester carboxylesterase